MKRARWNLFIPVESPTETPTIQIVIHLLKIKIIHSSTLPSSTGLLFFFGCPVSLAGVGFGGI